MGFFDTFAGVFMAQALIWFIQWLLKQFAEPRLNRAHKRLKKDVKRVLRHARRLRP